MLHSKVLSWLPLSAAVELLEPGLVFSVAAVEPEAGGGAAVAIKTDPLKKHNKVEMAKSNQIHLGKCRYGVAIVNNKGKVRKNPIWMKEITKRQIVT